MTEIARMYGGSLYDLAAEEGLETRILDELDEAAKLIRDDPESSLPPDDAGSFLAQICTYPGYTYPSLSPIP